MEYDPAQFGITGMSPGYLKSLMEDIQRRGDITRGQATARGTAAGMQYDDPSVAIARQGAISGTQREMGQTVGGLAHQSWQEQQQMAEREKDRQLQLQLARLRMGGGGGYRPPAYQGRLPYTQPTSLSSMAGPAAGMGEATGGPQAPTGQAPAMPSIQQRVEQAYNPPQLQWPGAGVKGPFQRRTQYGY